MLEVQPGPVGHQGLECSVTNRPDHRPVTITIDDDHVRIHPGMRSVADLKQAVRPPIPPDHRLWVDVDHGPDLDLPDDGQIDVREGLVLYSQGPDGARPARMPIVIDRQRVGASAVSVTGVILRNLVDPPIPADRDLWREVAGSLDEQIDDDEVVTLTRGDEFYSVPRLITPGYVPQLRPEDADYLVDRGYRHTVHPDGTGLSVVLNDIDLPSGLNLSAVDLLVTLPGGFNDAAPDMFWCYPALTRPGGQVIAGTESTRDFAGRTWQRWSRHIGGGWRPGIDNLATYLAYVRRCLAQAAAAAA